MNSKKNVGFWILIGIGIILNIIYLLGQTMSIVDYDFTVSIGLQEHVNEITEVGVALNKGFGFGDTVFYIPIFIIAIIGMLYRKKIGYFTMIAAMAITVYWPLVSISTLYYANDAPGWNFEEYTSYTITLSLIALYGIWGLWFLYKNRIEFLN